MDCFLESVDVVQGTSIEAWKKEWKKILAVIVRTNPTLPGIGEDRQFIDSLLNRGEFVVHHSEVYLDTYHPHYRIIHRQVFEDQLADYLVNYLDYRDE